MFGGSDGVVVVTGGAGFIGSHVVDRLVKSGRRVVVLDNFSTGRRENLAQYDGDDRVGVVECDVAAGVDGALAGIDVDRVVHLAAQVTVVTSVAEPMDDVRVNCGATVAVLEYARGHGVKKVVFSSSAAVYGDVAVLPVRETSECRPMSPYGIDKLSSEYFLKYYSAVHGVPGTVFRFFNVYGPRQDPSSPYSGVISIFADRARTNETITIFGDGEQTRDFVYVADVARAVVDACLSDDAATDGAVMNIGTGRAITVNELAREVVALRGSSSTIVHAQARAGEIRESVPRSTRHNASSGSARSGTSPTGCARR